MSEIKKYRYASTHPLSNGQIHEYVRVEDYERLSAELEQVRANNRRLEKIMVDGVTSLADEMERANKAYAELRETKDMCSHQERFKHEANKRAEFAESKNTQLVAQVAVMKGKITAIQDQLHRHITGDDFTKDIVLDEIHDICIDAIDDLPAEAEKLVRVVEAAAKVVEIGPWDDGALDQLEQAYRDLRG